MPTVNPNIPSNNLNQSHLPTKRHVFKTRMSPLNTLTTTKPSIVTSSNVLVGGHVGSTRLHLANLERLLRNRPDVVGDHYTGVTGAKKGKGILGFLDFTGIWKDEGGAVVEEEEPQGCVNGLQRLLSMTNEYSPRNRLDGRWREYHGRDDWAGMLDPLDENLRREVVRYGEFVQAAYDAFLPRPAKSPEEDKRTLTSSESHVAAVDRSYRVTRTLYATSTVGLPGWVDGLALGLRWLIQRSSPIGYVAVCNDWREIQRMGRRDIVIALRGTVTCPEWAENFRANLVPILDHSGEASATSQGQPEVECGFLSLYKTSGSHIPSLSESIIQEVTRLVEKYKDEPLSITVTGHSLGAALAILIADELSTVFATPIGPPVAVFSFGGPKVGNRAFGDQIREKNVKVLRIVNNQDIITKVPAGITLNKSTRLKLRKLARIEVKTPWDGYSHVGTELRVDTRLSPYLRPDADIACCHDLEAYLHLVDGFLSSSCPFRSNAKRSLAKLMFEQGSNVKRLDASKARTVLEQKGQPRTGNIIVQ
ncbi:hypothetical protein MLD38_015481 [Melastoma candidum]|uniref:Uncharacterized protein n=1 Tax=Melastoma candidum TaxID=119954 RepID=A0ACB9RKG0_9MYRT|nr:hypothetical protein MLD38_015481 [Melastoma candidum]